MNFVSIYNIKSAFRAHSVCENRGMILLIEVDKHEITDSEGLALLFFFHSITFLVVTSLQNCIK